MRDWIAVRLASVDICMIPNFCSNASKWLGIYLYITLTVSCDERNDGRKALLYILRGMGLGTLRRLYNFLGTLQRFRWTVTHSFKTQIICATTSNASVLIPSSPLASK